MFYEYIRFLGYFIHDAIVVHSMSLAIQLIIHLPSNMRLKTAASLEHQPLSLTLSAKESQLIESSIQSQYLIM